MKLLAELREEDIFSERLSPAPAHYSQRQAVRAVVLDGERVALLHVAADGYHKIPGGGIEEGEDRMAALAREVREEAGCSVEVVEELGAIVEYRDQDSLRQESHCYLARVVGPIGQPEFTDSEKEEAFSLIWVDSLAEAVRLAEADRPEGYEARFMAARDLLFLKEAQGLQ